jgi:Fe-S cluster assembly protein SufD
MYITLEEKALCHLQDHVKNSLSIPSFHHVHIDVKQDAKATYFQLQESSYLTYTDLEIHLLEEGADIKLKGLDWTRSKGRHHIHTKISHLSPSAISHQHFKSIVGASGLYDFAGKIYVAPRANKTESYQLNQNLLLDERGRVLSRPNLEIFADDVKASHGSTTGKLDEEELFYLRSRGLSISQARALQIRGFIEEFARWLPPHFQL